MLRDYPCVLDPSYTPPPAPAPWATTALRAVIEVAKLGEPFTSVEVWHLLERWGTPPPKEKRAMGSVITSALAAGLIRSTDQFVTTQLHGSHPMPRRQYRGE